MKPFIPSPRHSATSWKFVSGTRTSFRWPCICDHENIGTEDGGSCTRFEKTE